MQGAAARGSYRHLRTSGRVVTVCAAVAVAVAGCGGTAPAEWHQRAVRQDGQGFAETVAATVGQPPGRPDCMGAFAQRLRRGGRMVDGYDPSGDDRLRPADERGWVDACAAVPTVPAHRATPTP